MHRLSTEYAQFFSVSRGMGNYFFAQQLFVKKVEVIECEGVLRERMFDNWKPVAFR